MDVIGHLVIDILECLEQPIIPFQCAVHPICRAFDHHFPIKER